jgi:glycosyltransferase involved in cell wall biosynthesis
MSASSRADVAVIIPARNEADRIAATIAAAKTMSDVVIVVDDGSTDGTTPTARDAGALVVVHTRNRGKGAAMTTGAGVVAGLDVRDGLRTPRHLLFLDADLEETAKEGTALVEPVRAGAADMTIGVLPPQKRKGGGFGFVVRLSRNGVRRLTGFEAIQPLSGQRCLTRAAFTAAQPLAHGWGVETAMLVDLLCLGMRVQEVEVDLHHRVTGRDLRAQIHRLRQYRDVAAALAVRQVAPAHRRSAR